jgi:hypothetical protein
MTSPPRFVGIELPPVESARAQAASAPIQRAWNEQLAREARQNCTANGQRQHELGVSAVQVRAGSKKGVTSIQRE